MQSQLYKTGQSRCQDIADNKKSKEVTTQTQRRKRRFETIIVGSSLINSIKDKSI